MNREEAKRLMAVIKAAYPSYYKGASAQDMRDAVDLWENMFAEDNFASVAGAVKAYIATDEKGFPPAIGQIKAQMRKITKTEYLPETQAWSILLKALKNSGYHAQEEYEKLPEEIKACVNPDLMREWALDETGSEQVIASNFMRTYRVVVKRREENEALPADVKLLIQENIKMLED